MRLSICKNVSIANIKASHLKGILVIEAMSMKEVHSDIKRPI